MIYSKRNPIKNAEHVDFETSKFNALNITEGLKSTIVESDIRSKYHIDKSYAIAIVNIDITADDDAYLATYDIVKYKNVEAGL
jgi:hypothetical protein